MDFFQEVGLKTQLLAPSDHPANIRNISTLRGSQRLSNWRLPMFSVFICDRSSPFFANQSSKDQQ